LKDFSENIRNLIMVALLCTLGDVLFYIVIIKKNVKGLPLL